MSKIFSDEHQCSELMMPRYYPVNSTHVVLSSRVYTEFFFANFRKLGLGHGSTTVNGEGG